MIVFSCQQNSCPPRLRAAGCVFDQVRQLAWFGPPGQVPPDLLPGEPKVGLEGLGYWWLPGLTVAHLRRPELPELVVTIPVPDHGPLPVAPALADGFVIGLDGQVDPTRPGSAYARLAYRVEERLAEEGSIPVTDPDLLALAKAVLGTTHRGPHEAWHELGLLTTRTILALCRGAWERPKACAASGR